jgi:hypothetical protein
MDTIELQKALIERITATNDIDILNSIKTILDFKKRELFLYLTSEEEEELEKAANEVKEGQYVNQSVMDQKVKGWLKEK